MGNADGSVRVSLRSRSGLCSKRRHPAGWHTGARVVVGAFLAFGGIVAAQAAYIPVPQVGDVFNVAIDLNGDTIPDGTTTLTLISGGSGAPGNSTLSPFSLPSGGQNFSFPSSPATWFFGDAAGVDGFTAQLASSGCTPGGISPCSLLLNFARDYTGTGRRFLGEGDNTLTVSYPRLVPRSQVAEPEMLLLLATALAAVGVFRCRGGRRAGAPAAF